MDCSESRVLYNNINSNFLFKREQTSKFCNKDKIDYIYFALDSTQIMSELKNVTIWNRQEKKASLLMEMKYL